MTHVLPPHPQLDIRSSEGQDSIQQMDQQPHIDTQQSQQSQAQSTPSQGRKRKKAENGEPSTPAEPRRLRRSHEACARCRSKKIKVGTISRSSSSLDTLARRGKSRRSTPPAISWSLPLDFSLSPALCSPFHLSFHPYSATPNIQDAPPAQPPGPPVTKKTGIVRPSPSAATLNISNTSSPNAMPFSNAVFLALRWKISKIFSFVKASKSRPVLPLPCLPPSSSLPVPVRFFLS
jgi:hypothetical protein